MLKICKHHGQLPPELIRICNKRKSKPVLICILCNRERGKKSYKKNIHKHKARKKIDYEKNKEKYIEYSKNYRINNPEKIKLCRKKYGENNKDKIRNFLLFSKFNITLDEYNSLLKSQNNVCAICKLPEKTLSRGNYIRDLSVDHCHKTKKIRGLLCSNCNIGLGNLQDSIEILKSAIKYLIRQK